MKCPYCMEEIEDNIDICPNCFQNNKNFNKVLEAKENDKYTRQIIIKSCLIFFILFISVFTCILLLI